MACINADGSLTPIAKKVLTALVIPGSAHVPLYRVRSSFRELTAFGAMEEIDGLYQISDYGRELLAK
jgi:hypothetical protein